MVKMSKVKKLIDKQAAIDGLWNECLALDTYMNKCLKEGHMVMRAYAKADRKRIEEDIHIIQNLPSIQSEIYWGYTPTAERPLADLEIVSRLRSIQKQMGGSYAIDRAIEIIEAVAERGNNE